MEFSNYDYYKFLLMHPISYIEDNIYIGNIVAATNDKTLLDNGITAVINLSHQSIEYPDNIKHLDIFIKDSPDVEISNYFDQTYKFINKHNKNGKVLVHCYAGVSRSSTIVLYYLMRKYQIDLLEALYTVMDKRMVINPNKGFLVQLMEYEKTLQKKIKIYKKK